MKKILAETACLILMTILCMSNLKAQNDTLSNKTNSWVKWCSSIDGWIGYSGTIDWKVGARWTIGDYGSAGVSLGDRITKVKFIVQHTYLISYCAIEIYQGGTWPSNQGTLVRQQNVPVASLIDATYSGTYTEIVLTNPVAIDITKELWVVYHIKTTGGAIPFGRDGGPAVHNKGNIMYWYDWSTMYMETGKNANWSIEFYTEPSPPTITTNALPNATVGGIYNQTLTATGTNPITWSITSGNLPDGLTLSENGVISGTPTIAGTSSFTVTATNSIGSNSKILSITAAIPPVITTNDLPNGMAETPYNQMLAATGTTPITWSRESGNLPNGLTLSGNGVISGTPTTAGTFNFTVKATNSVGFNTKAFSITILAPPVITTNNLPNGTIGTAYSQTLAADGDTPITWSLINGILPTGLTLYESGIISGISTAAGTFNFTVQASNSAGSDTKTLNIYVNTVGVSENKIINIVIFPNPTTGELQIENYEIRIESIEIIDVYGRNLKIEGEKQEEMRIQLDISHLSAGTYFVKIYTVKGEVVRKVVKE